MQSLKTVPDTTDNETVQPNGSTGRSSTDEAFPHQVTRIIFYDKNLMIMKGEDINWFLFYLKINDTEIFASDSFKYKKSTKYNIGISTEACKIFVSV